MKCPKCGEEMEFVREPSSIDEGINEPWFGWICYECNYQQEDEEYAEALEARDRLGKWYL